MPKYENKVIKQKAFENIRQEVLINMVVATQQARKVFEQVCESEDISLPQFNILRILKGVYPGTYPRSEIKKRMIDNSDVTRLIDRLEATGMVKRVAATDDKRQSVSAITAKGIKTLERLSPRFAEAHNLLTQHLTVEELEALSMLLKKISV